jgi:nitroreductase
MSDRQDSAAPSEAAPTGAEALGRLDTSLVDMMMTQRAIRRVLPDPVDDAVVLKCIELALHAPTGNNGQNWEFIVVKDGRVKERLAKRYRQAWKFQYGVVVRRLIARDPSMAKTARAVQWQVDHFEEIPVLVVACLRLGAREGRLPFVRMPHAAESAYYGSIYPSVQNLLLAARAMGLGACLITLPLWSLPAARKILGLPHSVTPCCIVPLGWPRGGYGPTTRIRVEEVTHRDAYGNRVWFNTFERPAE